MSPKPTRPPPPPIPMPMWFTSPLYGRSAGDLRAQVMAGSAFWLTRPLYQR